MATREERRSQGPTPRPITVPLRSLAANPNYFTDGSGKAVYLTGSHTWNTLQDWGTDGAIQPLDYAVFVKMLAAHRHNFTLLWTTELPRFHGLPTTASSPPDFSVSPFPWQRTGPGTASDGKPRFDLTRLNQAYFDRLRDRVLQLNAAGIYAGVYFFSGEWLLRFRCPEDGYPFTGPNNVNGIDDGGGMASVTMTSADAITAIQDVLVKKMIDTLNDLPNVLWIVSQEAPVNSTWWNSHLIAVARSYEAGKPLQHPIGYGALDGGSDDVLLSSDADWIAPAVRISPTSSCGTGHPRCKVNINDSDHSYWGMWNDTPQVNRNYFWINFTNGNQTLFMDPWVVFYPRENRNLCPSPVNGIGMPDTRWENVRATMGYIRGYADRMDLAGATPLGRLSSTGHALGNVDAARPEILVYAPSGGQITVDLSALPHSRALAVEWFDPTAGAAQSGGTVAAGSSSVLFTPPFSGDAVLYLRFMRHLGAAEAGGTKAAVKGTGENPWVLVTPPGTEKFTAYRDPNADPPALVVRVGKTEVRYHMRCIEDLHAMLVGHDDWMELGGADEIKPAKRNTVEAWGRSPDNPVKGWYGLKRGLRGRFAVYVPPVLEALGLAELEHKPRDNRMRVKVG